MKKIVSAVALAAVAAGFATAEAKVSANFRARQNVLAHQFGHATTVFDQDGVDFESDSVSVKGSAEYGGFEFEVTSKNVDGTQNSSATFAKYN